MRSDLPAPRIKRVSDTNNYGDASTAGDLLHPSVHAIRGVHEEHFFCPRSKKEVRTMHKISGTMCLNNRIRFTVSKYSQEWTHRRGHRGNCYSGFV